MEKTEKLVLIDGNSLINRAFYALPPLKTNSGEYSNAVYGFCNILLKLIETEKPKYMAVAFDLGYPTFRHEMYAEYKAGRKKMPEELASQLPILKSVLEAMNITFVEQRGIEADDLIGTLAKKFDTQTIIVSGDRDLFQLVDDTTSVWFTKRGISEAVIVTPQNIKEVYGVYANQVTDLKALMGDSSDNIKGVAGIGEKTAKKLLEEYQTLENVLEHAKDQTASVSKHLIEGAEDGRLSKMLATIKTDVDLKYDLKDLEFDFPFKREVFDLFTHYEFWSILKKAEIFENAEIQIQKKSANIKYLKSKNDIELLYKNLASTDEFAIEIFDDEIHIANSKFEENIIKIAENELNFDEIMAKFKDFLQNDKIKKDFLNSKNMMRKLSKFDIFVSNICFDANIALYILSGSQKTDFDAKSFTKKFGYEENCIASCLFSVKDELFAEIEKNDMSKLYFEIEIPLVPVLFEMEQNGFKIDIQKLAELREEYRYELSQLTKEIWQDAGEEFNVNSPKQLSVILFEKLGIKTPRGLKKSTGVEVLERIVDEHPIVEKLLRYRKIEKLFSTYIEPFEELAEKDTHLIHTIFNQTLTSTGRLSSSEPNLQNIPVRSEEGKKLRKLFIPREADGKIITSDYSQIELRLVAHFSNDEKLQYAYHHDIDIHAQTASDIFDVPLELVTDKMRRDAKTVNFGILYGISDYGLAQNLHTSRSQAKEFIEKYFATYKGVDNYMKSCVERAKETGFVTTLLGRKRNIDELKSSNYMTRLFGERVAMNMPLQGTASDIIKIAMINVYNAFKKNNLKSKLILQIHDELIVDAVNGEEEVVKNILKTEMENATKLSIPLLASIGEGETWFDAK